MSYPIYEVPKGDVLPILFATYDGGTGASITMTGLAVTDIEIYKDGSVTQRASDAGYTLLDTDGIDFDGITGIHGFSIDTGDNTTAGFFEVGPWYHVVVSAITVDAQTVNFIAAAFRIVAGETATGTVAAYTNATSVTLPTGKNIAKGQTFVVTGGTGYPGAATVLSYTTGTGATVFDAPGVPAALDATTTFVVFDSPNPQTIETGSDDRVLVSADAHTSGAETDLTAGAIADVNAQVVDALATDTYAEPGQGAPAATATLAGKIGYLYKAWRNRVTQTADTYSLYADDATTVDQKATVADNGTTFSRTEIATGP